MPYDDLVKRLRNCLSDAVEGCAGCPYQGGYKGTYCMNGLIAEAADAIEELSKHRWIPVTERLPDTMKDKSVYSGWSAEIAPSDDVLCYLGREKRQTVAWYSHTYKEWTTVDENTVYKYGEVTHWMPLPEPPKEE